MENSKTLDGILERYNQGKKSYWVLLDPDDFSVKEASETASRAAKAGAHAILVGGSLLHTNHLDAFVKAVRENVSIPVVLFPGDAAQVSGHADALLFLSLVSGRNPVNLIGEHVKAAPLIYRLGIEPIPTAYLLVESGIVSSVEFMSNTRPIPRNKPMIAAAHALAAQYMGMQLIYLEGGSGAKDPVPDNMIRMVRQYTKLPLIAGGGIRDAKTAQAKLAAGADIIVTGNVLRGATGISAMRSIAKAVKAFK